MKKLFIIILGVTLLASCRMKNGSGNVVTEDRKLDGFTGVNAGGSFTVKLKQGSSYKVSVQADDNIIDDIETDVDGDVLEIHYKNGVSISNATATIYIEAPSFTFIGGSASANIESQNTLKSDAKLKADASSAADIQLTIDAPQVEAEANSGSTLALKGQTKDIDVQASSGAHLEAYDLLSENAKAQASSGASIDLHASVNLNAQASSGASVNYRGNPAVSKQESSGGSISHKD
ncbi:MAG: head GIN domain-containing protein [Ferruginibacter sp.]